MRKLKNESLLGKTRYAPGVGFVRLEHELPEHIVGAFDAAGADYFEAADAGEDNAAEDAANADNGETPSMASVAAAAANVDNDETPSMATVRKRGKK